MVCLGVWHQPENQPCRVTDPGDVPPALIRRDWVREDIVASTRVFVRRVDISRDQLAGLCPSIHQGGIVCDKFSFPMPHWDPDALESRCPYARTLWVELKGRPSVLVVSAVIEC